MTNPRLFLSLWHAEAHKLTRRALLWIEMGLLGLLVSALYAALLAVLAHPQGQNLAPEAVTALRASLRWPQGLLGALTFANGGELGGLFAVVLVGALVAQEYTWRTLPLWLGRGVSRPAYLLAKAAALTGALALLALVPLVAGGAVSGAVTWREVGYLPWEAIPWGDLLLGWLRVLLTLAPYAALTLLVAVVSRSPLTAIGVGLGYNLLVENLAVEVLLMLSPQAACVARYLPGLAAKAALAPLTAGMQVEMGLQRQGAALLLEPGTATWVLLGYTLALLTLALVAFRRQDITA